MTYIVQSVSKRAGDPPVRMTKTTKQEALDTAVGFIGQGMENVSIVDGKGRSFTLAEFIDQLNESA